uniref:F5/8 type C domain-containing protein n=1 Tax=viral metagenome TaxID=1070528 RepID=A0A6H1ZDS9_9ZZZZ
MATYTLQYPPAHDDTYVKSTTKFSTDYWAYIATNPATPLTGTGVGTNWIAASGAYTNQRFHIDLGSAKIIRRIYYENRHNSGGDTENGVKNFIFQGSNNAAAFAELTYATDTNWTAITTAQSTFDQHVALDQADPKYILATNTKKYQYYAFKFADNWSGANQMALRRVSLMTEDGYYPPAGGLGIGNPWIFMKDMWEKHNKLWIPKLILQEDLGFNY